MIDLSIKLAVRGECLMHLFWDDFLFVDDYMAFVRYNWLFC